MASPKFNELHARFSRAIEDPITAATASTDGDVSAASRSDYLNRATNEFVQNAYALLGKDKARTALHDMIDTQSVAIASAGVAVEATYQNLPLDFIKTGSTAKYIYFPNKSSLDTYRNPHIDYAYVVEGGSIYVYENGSIINAGNGTLYHIGYRVDHTGLDTGGTGDTTLPVRLYDIVVELAVSLYYLDIGQDDKAVRERYKQMLALFVKNAQ